MGGFSGKIDNQSSPFLRKREVPRFALIVSVEVTESNTGVRTSGQISEISRKGCYIDIVNTLPVTTPIKIVISRDQETFTTDGTVIYTQEGIGMGVAFKQPALEQLGILDVWLGASTSLCFFAPTG
jgi:hypothetical protein